MYGRDSEILACGQGLLGCGFGLSGRLDLVEVEALEAEEAIN